MITALTDSLVKNRSAAFRWRYFVKGSSPTLYEILAMGTLPFIAGGLIKVVVAAAITKEITPKEDFR